MDEPIWLDRQEVLLVHSRQLAMHGGSDGIRDGSLLDSALAKPRNVLAYGYAVTLQRLAASYAYGIARNHPFVDGNKQTALAVSVGFLRLNGLRIVTSQEDIYLTFLHLADGSLSEEALTAWFTAHTMP